MPAAGLHDFLALEPQFDHREWDSVFGVRHPQCSPGYIVALTALAHRQGLRFADIQAHLNFKRYAEAVGMQEALDGFDNYPFTRHAQGTNYSRLALLKHEYATEDATSQVNGCIRALFRDAALAPFLHAICRVVGDLHDNVWSHGRSTGFSFAQRWQKPYVPGHFLLEFALADCGSGFLSELRRVGLDIRGDADAIDWCIVRGNTTKRRAHGDVWQQRLPADVMGNPMPGIARPVESDNNHMGLGLHMLVELITTFRGDLWLGSGTQVLHLDQMGTKRYSQVRLPWPGVAIACRFDTELLAEVAATEPDELTKLIARAIGGA